MNFGDILKDWESMRGRREQSAQTSKSPPKAKEKSPSGARKKAPQGELPSPKHPSASTGSQAPRQKPGAIHEVQRQWLDDYGVTDKDGEERARHERGLHKFLTKREIDAMPIDAMIDLHGMTALAAEDALDDFFTRAEEKHLRKVLIIHGKGLHSERNSVLGDVVKRWLERRPSAGRTGFAGSELGGGGATWVLLKNMDQRSR